MDLRIEASSLQISEEEKTAVLGALNDPFYLQTQVFLLFIFQLSYLLAEDGATYDQKVLSVEYVPPKRQLMARYGCNGFLTPKKRGGRGRETSLKRGKWNWLFVSRKSGSFETDGTRSYL